MLLCAAQNSVSDRTVDGGGGRKTRDSECDHVGQGYEVLPLSCAARVVEVDTGKVSIRFYLKLFRLLQV